MFLMYIFGGCSDSVNVDGGSAVKGVKMEIGVAVSQGNACILNTNFSLNLHADFCISLQFCLMSFENLEYKRWRSLESVRRTRAIRLSSIPWEDI